MSDEAIQVPVTVLPAVHHIVSEAEEQLFKLVGARVKIKLNLRVEELAEIRLQNLVCDQYGVAWGQIKSRSRQTEYVTPRHVYSYLAKALLGHSLTRIATDTGRADHTTVLHAVNKVAVELNVKPQVARAVRIIQDKYLKA